MTCWRNFLPSVLLLLGHTVQAATLPAVEAANGMVVSAHRLASEAGIAMLQQGGNAIDAAVAVGYAEAVVNPCCGNIGGGGFMVAHLADGRNIFVNFRETAPAAATPGHVPGCGGKVVPGASLHGWPAVAVPGTVLGVDTALTQDGTLRKSVVMAPAIRLAREGFVLTRFDTDIMQRSTASFRRQPNVARSFLHADGTPLQPGDRLVQPDLAITLQAIADNGPDAFYRGRIPQEVEAASRAGGGIITAADFAAYRITQSAPLSCRLSRLCLPVGAAAVFGRRDVMRDPANPRRLRYARAGLPLGPGRAPDDRGDASRLFRPQQLSWGSGFRRPTRLICCCCCRRISGPSVPDRRPRHPVSHPDPRRRAARTHRDHAIFRARQGGQRGLRSPTRSTAASAPA